MQVQWTLNGASDGLVSQMLVTTKQKFCFVVVPNLDYQQGPLSTDPSYTSEWLLETWDAPDKTGEFTLEHGGSILDCLQKAQKIADGWACQPL